MKGETKVRERQKKITVLLGMLLIVCMACSIIYVNEQRHHECTSQGCPICLQVHIAKDLLNSIKGAVLGTLFIWHLYLMLINKKVFIGIKVCQLSPISLKVKLLN